MTTPVLSALFLLIACAHGADTARAQTPKLPPAHQLAGGVAPLVADLDGDGKKDRLFVAEDDAWAGYFVALMSTVGRLESGPVAVCCGAVALVRPGVFRATTKGMRGFSYYTFRWDAAAKDFPLIGYGTESFGNAVNDGSGKSSLNLLTGDFEAAFNSYDAQKGALVALPKVRKKIAVGRRIYLRRFGEAADEWVSRLAYDHFPAAVK